MTEDEELEEEDSEEEDEEESDDDVCASCGESPSDGELYCCGECDKYNCGDCYVEFDNVADICKKCIDKAYPRPTTEKIVYQEKIVEKPIIKYVDSDGNEQTPVKSRFE